MNPFSSEAIKIDPVSRRPDKPIPFDRPFPVVISLEDVESVSTVYAYKVVYRNMTEQENKGVEFGSLKSGRKIRDLEMKNGNAYPIPGVGIRKDLKQKLLIIEFPALPPNFHFDLVIIRKPLGEALKELRKYTDAIADSLVAGKRIDLPKLEREFYRFQSSIDKKVYPAQGKAFLIDRVWDDARCCNENDPACLSKMNLYECLYTQKGLDTAYRGVYQHDFTMRLANPTDVFDIYRFFTLEKIAVPEMGNLQQFLMSIEQTGILNGQLSILNGSFDKVKWFELGKRVSNLDTTINLLNRIRLKLPELLGLRPNDRELIQRFSGHIDGMLSRFIENRERLAGVNKFINEVISGHPHLRYTEWYVSTTEVRDLATKSGYIFTPQIGLSVLATRNNENEMNYIPKLNWGINVNLRAIDKLISRRYLNNPTIWHYVSLHVGLTIGNFRDKEYENLYSSTSLLLGLNLRLTRTLYYSAGFSLYRQKNRNPLSNQYQVTTGGYTSLLLDLDITNAISIIRNSLFK